MNLIKANNKKMKQMINKIENKKMNRIKMINMIK